MKRGRLALLLLFILFSAWASGSWNTVHPVESQPPIIAVQPSLEIEGQTFNFSEPTRPWLDPNLLAAPIKVQPEPDAILASYSFNGEETWARSIKNGDLLPFPERDGITKITLHIDYSQTTQSFNKELFVAPRRNAKYELTQTTYLPGELIIIRVSHLETGQQLTVSGDWFSIEPEWFRHNGQGLILYPIPSSTKPGKYSLTLQAENERKRRFTVTVADREFLMQPLTIDPKVNQATRNDNSYAEFHEMLTASRNVTESMPLFDSAFVLPLEGRMTTEYGQGRTINGVPSGSRHSGYDLAAPTGTDIQATQTGKVRFAGELIMTGNTIILEHGLGIFSQYYHLDQLAVEAGKVVQQGEILGTVGSTGFSTGPHLHFCIFVNGAYVDPAVFLEGTAYDWARLLPQ